MIVLKENERLYATSWQYNSARILTRLAQLITAQGGKVKPLYPAVISDRNLEQAYCSYDCYHGIAQYVATAICPNEIAKDFTAPCYVVTWPIIRPSAENEEDACDWSTPDGLIPNGEYDLKRRYHY